VEEGDGRAKKGDDAWVCSRYEERPGQTQSLEVLYETIEHSLGLNSKMQRLSDPENAVRNRVFRHRPVVSIGYD
jgi:regulator of sirC expression with transglutaminase-like and TPR domain